MSWPSARRAGRRGRASASARSSARRPADRARLLAAAVAAVVVARRRRARRRACGASPQGVGRGCAPLRRPRDLRPRRAAVAAGQPRVPRSRALACFLAAFGLPVTPAAVLLVVRPGQRPAAPVRARRRSARAWRCSPRPSSPVTGTPCRRRARRVLHRHEHRADRGRHRRWRSAICLPRRPSAAVRARLIRGARRGCSGLGERLGEARRAETGGRRRSLKRTASRAEHVARRGRTTPATMSNTKWLPVAITARPIAGPQSSASSLAQRVAHGRGDRDADRRRRSRRAGSAPPRARCRSSSSATSPSRSRSAARSCRPCRCRPAAAAPPGTAA